MKWVCTENCYFLSNLWQTGDEVEGDKFVDNKYFEPMDNEAVELCQKAGRDDDVTDYFAPDIEPDPALMRKPLQELKAIYHYVEWKHTMRKADFVKAIMSHGK